MRTIRRDNPSLVGVVMTIVNLFLGLVLFFIGIRIVLELLGANRGSGFVQFIYGISAPFIAPFSGIFPSQTVGDGFFLNAAAILAFIVYAAILYLINAVTNRYSYTTTEERRDY